MRNIIMCKPFADIKSYSLCIEDTDKAQVMPIIYFKKAVNVSDAEYERIMGAMRVGLNKDYVPNIIEEAELVEGEENAKDA